MFRRTIYLVLLGFGASVATGFAEESPLRPTTVNPLEKTSPQAASLSLFNPAMGIVLDAALSSTRDERSNFSLRSAEFNFTAAIDPFANLYAIVNATSDGVELEEAAFLTTSLPYNLTVRGGRFFANFGRLPHWHPHEYPVVEGFESIETFAGGESQSDGLELMHLFKTPFFLQGTLGAYNKMGAENDRLESDGTTTDHSESRPWQAMTYLTRLLTYVPVSDLTGIDIGASYALTPRQYYVGGVRVDDQNTQRHLIGIDVTFRREATAAGQTGRFLWGTEFFRNDERRRQELALDTDNDTIGDTDTFERRNALGGYSYVDYRLAPRWSSGAFFDYAESLDDHHANEKHYGAMLNFIPSEFQRIRLQYAQAKNNAGGRIDHQVFLQWFGTVGTHVHLFRDR